jgi:hypothetical protein
MLRSVIVYGALSRLVSAWLAVPFCGSRTSIIAAEITGRVCHAIEIDPAYVDVSVQRWHAFTGEAATLEANGEMPRLLVLPAERGQGVPGDCLRSLGLALRPRPRAQQEPWLRKTRPVHGGFGVGRAGPLPP